MIKSKSVEFFIYRSAIFRCISLILLIGVSWGQSTDSLIVDESSYDNGNLKHQRFYNDGKANGISVTEKQCEKFKEIIYKPLENYTVGRNEITAGTVSPCLLYTSPSPRDQRGSRMPSSA